MGSNKHSLGTARSSPGWEDCSVLEVPGAPCGPTASRGDTCSSL